MICELLINGKQVIQLTEPFYTIGRSQLCDIIIIADKTLSRFHCNLAQVEANYQIADGNALTRKTSANGTRINGLLLNPDYGQELKHGDLIELSPVTKIKFFLKEAPNTDADSTIL